MMRLTTIWTLPAATIRDKDASPRPEAPRDPASTTRRGEAMSKRKECSWWRGHDWRADGLTGPLTMREVCTRCGLAKVFNGAMDETYYIEPKEGR